MSKIFNKNEQPKVEIGRNTFDLSFQNNLTMELGKIYPVMCKEVLPGDTFKIQSAFGLRFMPLAFPIQTKMRADLHFFYVRNRNLWDQWTNFIGRTGMFSTEEPQNLDDETPYHVPYLSYAQLKRQSVTGSLGDYLGLPTTVPSGSGIKRNVAFTGSSTLTKSQLRKNVLGYQPLTEEQWISGTYQYLSIMTTVPLSSSNFAKFEPILARVFGNPIGVNMDMSTCNIFTPSDSDLSNATLSNGYVDVSDCMPSPSGNLGYAEPWRIMKALPQVDVIPPSDYSWLAMPVNTGNDSVVNGKISINIPKRKRSYKNTLYSCISVAKVLSSGSIEDTPIEAVNLSVKPCKVDFGSTRLDFMFKGTLPAQNRFVVYLWFYTVENDGTITYRKSLSSVFEQVSATTMKDTFNLVTNFGANVGNERFTPIYVNPTLLRTNFNFIDIGINGIYSASEQTVDITDSDSSNLRSYLENTKVSSLPFRAYEAIYNSYYRDQRNNPYYVDGVADPNVYIPNNKGGVDNSVYTLHSRNWEQDFLTSAQTSPQQGNFTPLVGVTATGVATFQNANGANVTAKLVTDDNDRVTGVSFLGDNAPDASVAQASMNIASSGISINDFRAVNSYQRWLETNLRRGLKYKDQLMSHFGVDASYSLLDMPEFIGGSSRSVQIDQINQTSASTSDDPLGSYAGQASCVGGNDHDIEHYCDEHGFIIACLSIVPVPSYSQLMPKHYLKFNHLDYFFPEFGHIGYQPIKYNEVCPAQAYSLGLDVNNTYGYQRAWYDYLASTDEIHGQFRTTLQPFCLTRVFQSLPTISPDFLLIDQSQLNEVFTVTEIDGAPVQPILGQIHFDITACRKIPRYGIPRIE